MATPTDRGSAPSDGGSTPSDGSSAPVTGIRALPIWRADRDGCTAQDDPVAVEAPLEFLLHHPAWGTEPVSFGTTMRTPGEDEVLAVGLLYGEGVVADRHDIDVVESSTRRPNVVNVRLRAGLTPDVQSPGRRFSAGSSCGICGTTGLDAAIARAAATTIVGVGVIDIDVLLGLPALMRQRQSKFGATGGIHAAALFDLAGNLKGVAEDVGRHNAFDKLVGENFMAARLPLTDHAVVLSGRASFELVQKALRAGVSVLAAIGAPSSLAVNLATAAGLTLIGFLRATRCNVYANPQRLKFGRT